MIEVCRYSKYLLYFPFYLPMSTYLHSARVRRVPPARRARPPDYHITRDGSLAMGVGGFAAVVYLGRLGACPRGRWRARPSITRDGARRLGACARGGNNQRGAHTNSHAEGE